MKYSKAVCYNMLSPGELTWDVIGDVPVLCVSVQQSEASTKCLFIVSGKIRIVERANYDWSSWLCTR